MSKVLIIAEAGVNHNGDLAMAKKLIDLAKTAGADIVKFQTFKAENLVTKDAQKAQYQIENTKNSESQFEMLKKLELSEKEFIELSQYCKQVNIQFLSTGFDLDSLAFLKDLNAGLWKIPSGEITNLPYLEFIGRLNHKVIISTGMATLTDIREAINVLMKCGTEKNNITVLHCTTSYPTKYCDVSLKAMNSIGAEFGVQVGYSDHTPGIEVSVAAVALGAKVIEKHFTLDKNLEGPDHLASLSPEELKSLITSIRNVEEALVGEYKQPTPAEIEISKIARKSIIAKTQIKKGDVLSLENLTIKRPGSGISPMRLNEVIGLRATRDFNEDELITL